MWGLPTMKEMEVRDRAHRQESANERFNIIRKDGVDYLTMDGVIISRPTDNDLLDRLNEIRDMYVGPIKETSKK